jgi:signal transduction histidine kinase
MNKTPAESDTTTFARNGLFDELNLAWLERWQRPKGAKAAKAWLAFLAIILATTGVIYQTGGTALVWVHLMYIPIILASAAFGWRGGLISAVVAGIALGPHMPLETAGHIPQKTANWLIRLGFFVLVGGCSGILFSWMNRQLERLRKTHVALLHTYDQLKAAQMNLIQTAKLESVGRLAAGVAHEVKNPLAVIQLGVDYLNGQIRENPPLTETLKDMDDAVKRADSVIKGLLDFSRSEKLTLAPYNLNALIDESLLLVKHELGRNHVTVRKDLQTDLPAVRLDRNKLKQVFINLFMNAIQAMGSGGGELAIRTYDRPLRDLLAPHETAALDENALNRLAVVVDVEDTGTGIPPDKLDKLFDPFFTTKAVGSGTGLGLSVSRKIVELHGASIKLNNREPRGAAARIIFKSP